MTELKLQMFAEGDPETGVTITTDIEPAISIDLATRMTSNIQALLDIISVNELVPMTEGSLIKMYEAKVKGKVAAQVAEGAVIPLTQVERKLKKTVEIKLKKYRRSTTAEAIQRSTREAALNQTDEALVKAVQKEIKTDFLALLGTGTGTAEATANGLQAALAAAWGGVQEAFDDIEASPVFFVSSGDVADYLATASVTMQTAFGLSYIENFLGLGTAFVTPALEKGTVIATAKENLYCAYIPANSGELAQTFGLTSDETGLVGLTHTAETRSAVIDTLIMSGVEFFPEDLSAVIKVAVKTAAGA